MERCLDDLNHRVLHWARLLMAKDEARGLRLKGKRGAVYPAFSQVVLEIALADPTSMTSISFQNV